MSDFHAESAEMSNRSQVKAVIPMYYDELIERLRNMLCVLEKSEGTKWS